MYLFETSDYGGKLMFTSEQLDALQAAAEKQAAAHAQMLEIGRGVGGLGVLYPDMFEDKLAWSNMSDNEHADTVLGLVAAHRAALSRIARVEAVLTALDDGGKSGVSQHSKSAAAAFAHRRLADAVRAALTEGEPDAD
ncbi:hypothetical protein ACFSWE_16555 [Leucobacter albus]|uniref:hypothetical protein n=1 Tax=Leucobacter albus TaxID=272210 RepID=UPI0031D5DEE2